MTINKERIELWAAALESGDYEQCRGNLYLKANAAVGWREGTDGMPVLVIAQRDHHCADGVAIDVALKHGLFNDHPERPSDGLVFLSGRGLLPECVSIWYGFDPEVTDPLLYDGFTEDGEEMTVVNANDAGFTFWEIAQMIRDRYLKDEGDH